MRVLLISHTCQSATEGQPKCAELAALGVQLCVLVPQRWKHYGRWRAPEPPHAPAFRFEPRGIRFASAGPAQSYLHHYPDLKELLREFRPQIIDLWEEPWSAVSFQACRLRNRVLPAARIISETEQNIDKHLPPPFEYFRRFTLRNADWVVGRNCDAIKIARRKGYSGPAEVVPNGVDTRLFRPMPRDECRRQLGNPGFLVGYVGRLVPEKGLLDILAAISLSPPDVRLILVGSGPLEAELRVRVRQSGLDARVQFMGSARLAALPSLMNALDVLVLASRSTPRWKEQFGRVLIEAHACGIPVIGSSSGAIPEVVGSGGLIFPEGDAAALARSIAHLRASPETARRMGCAGREKVENAFTWSCVAQRMRCIYERVVQAGARRS